MKIIILCTIFIIDKIFSTRTIIDYCLKILCEYKFIFDDIVKELINSIYKYCKIMNNFVYFIICVDIKYTV